MLYCTSFIFSHVHVIYNSIAIIAAITTLTAIVLEEYLLLLDADFVRVECFTDRVNVHDS